MNKAKLDTIMSEVLADLELDDVKEVVKEEYETHLLDNLSDLFRKARDGRSYIGGELGKELWVESSPEFRAYMKVKPLVSEAVDVYMSKLNKEGL